MRKVSPGMWQLKSVNYFLSSESHLYSMFHVLDYLPHMHMQNINVNVGNFTNFTQKLFGDEITAILLLDSHLAFVFTPRDKPSLVLVLPLAQTIWILKQIQVCLSHLSFRCSNICNTSEQKNQCFTLHQVARN